MPSRYLFSRSVPGRPLASMTCTMACACPPPAVSKIFTDTFSSPSPDSRFPFAFASESHTSCSSCFSMAEALMARDALPMKSSAVMSS